MFTPEIIDTLRQETPGTKSYIHLNNAGAALMPSSVLTAMTDYLALESQIGGYEAAFNQREALNLFSETIAFLLNAQPKNIAYAGSATDAYNKALSAIPFSAEDLIVTTQDDYVSNQIAFLQIKKKFGVEVIQANIRPDGGVDLAHMEALMKKHRPKLVAVTHIPTNSGLVQDVVAIGNLCEQYADWYLVDACQSAGQLPLDVQEIKCDFLSATFRKFLRGPRGSGFLYVSDKALAQQLEPLYLDLHSAMWTSPEQYALAADAKRFELWERPHALVRGATVATQIALGLGLHNISTQVKKIAQYCRNQLAELPGITVLDEGKELCGIVTFHHPSFEPLQLREGLKNRLINTSIVYKESALFDFGRKNVEWASRVSPHYYNTTYEIDSFIYNLKELISLVS